ncbi:hypothetical protein AUJ14_01030 [Candidatus Micrarchaeota archaeon CG1_02_55_22]|nr:MAG: hypothetical protein AUJ14_01030 [Candidatus Micrarchaeota archaeon CG1_02_55_22]
MYVTIPVKPETKKLIDKRKAELGATTYDETLQKLAKRNAFTELEKLAGSLTDAPEFTRDKHDRKIG